MNKEFFQRLFCKTTGQVYRFLGTVPANTDSVEYITKQLVDSAGNTQLSTMVIELPRHTATIIYVDDMTAIDSPVFALLTDLIPSLVVVDNVVDAVVEELTPPTEG